MNGNGDRVTSEQDGGQARPFLFAQYARWWDTFNKASHLLFFFWSDSAAPYVSPWNALVCYGRRRDWKDNSHNTACAQPFHWVLWSNDRRFLQKASAHRWWNCCAGHTGHSRPGGIHRCEPFLFELSNNSRSNSKSVVLIDCFVCKPILQL